MKHENLIACHECDLLFRKPPLLNGLVARCSRCGAGLAGIHRTDVTLNWVCSLTVAAFIAFLIAQCSPVIALEANGIKLQTTVFGAAAALWASNMQVVAIMVFCATILFPSIELLACLYLMLPMRAGSVPPGFRTVLRLLQFTRSWGMIEVFLLGVFITIVKMASIARVIPGTGLFAFGAMTFMCAATAVFDLRRLWEISDELQMRRVPINGDVQSSHKYDSTHQDSDSQDHETAQGDITSLRVGLVACHTCGRIQPWTRPPHQHCARCDSPLHERRPNSPARTLALVLTAALLYIPANLLPVMHTLALGRSEDDTILGGVAYFWSSGDWPLAVIVFVASIMVPMLKLAILALQAIAAQYCSTWQPLERAKLYRVVERIGRWSMLDIFVVALTVSLVHFGSFAVVTAGPGALAFGAVVILTMIASNQFDPRLIWDYIGQRASRPLRNSV